MADCSICIAWICSIYFTWKTEKRKQLEREISGFTEEQAVYGTENCGADWDQVAVDYVMMNLEYSEEPYTREQMIQEMVDYGGFTEDQAVYACDKAGLK